MSEPNIQWEKQQQDSAAVQGTSGFQHAPADWSPMLAQQKAEEEGELLPHRNVVQLLMDGLRSDLLAINDDLHGIVHLTPAEGRDPA